MESLKGAASEVSYQVVEQLHQRRLTEFHADLTVPPIFGCRAKPRETALAAKDMSGFVGVQHEFHDAAFVQGWADCFVPTPPRISVRAHGLLARSVCSRGSLPGAAACMNCSCTQSLTSLYIAAPFSMAYAKF